MLLRHLHVPVFAIRKAGAWLLAIMALAVVARAQITQPVPMQAGSGITIQVTNTYNGIPMRGYLPLRVNINNSSNDNGQWTIETQAVSGDGNNGRHFGTQTTCPVPAHEIRAFEVLAPLPNSGEHNLPRVSVRVTGPGVADPEVSFSSNLQQPPPNLSTQFSANIPGSILSTGGFSSGTITLGSGGTIIYSGGNTIMLGSSSGSSAATSHVGTTTTITNDGRNVTKTDVTTRPNGSTQTVSTTSTPEGAVRTRTVETDPVGRIIADTTTTTSGAPPPAPPAGTININGAPSTPGTNSTIYTGSTTVSGAQPTPVVGLPAANPQVAPSLPSAINVTPTAILTRNADGTTTRTTKINEPDGTVLTRNITLNADGSTRSNETTITDSAGRVISTNSEHSSSNSTVPVTPTPAAPAASGTSNKTSAIPYVPARYRVLAMAPVTRSTRNRIFSGAYVMAQTAPFSGGSSPSAPTTRLAPPPPPPPPSPAFAPTGARRGAVTVTSTVRGGRGFSTRITKNIGPAIFVGLSPTLSHDHGDQIKNYFMTICARPLQLSMLDPDLLSSDWRAFLGFDLLYYTAADWQATPAPSRTAILQWVAGGGTLRLVANQDGGLDLPPRQGDYYGAGVISLFSDDDLTNYSYTAEHVDPTAHYLFSLAYQPPLSGLAGDISTKISQQFWSLDSDVQASFFSALMGVSPAMVAQSNDLLVSVFKSNGIDFPAGATAIYDQSRGHLQFINTRQNLDAINQMIQAVLANRGASSQFMYRPSFTPLLSAASTTPAMPAPPVVAMVTQKYPIPDAVLQLIVGSASYFGAGYPSTPLKDGFISSGVEFPADAALTFNAGEISVTNTPANLDKLEQSLNAFRAKAGLAPIASLSRRVPPTPPGAVMAAASAASATTAKPTPATPSYFQEVPHLGNQYMLVAVVLFCFGIVVGPLNLFVFCNGTRRPHLLWVTPLLAIAASVAILAFILFAEGIGGRGIYFRLTQLAPDGKFAVESEVASSVTGLLSHHDFELTEPAWLLDYQSVDGGGSWRSGNFTQTGARYTGDWLISRREQTLEARAVVPSRAALRVDAAVPGQPPVMHSEYNGWLRNVFYQDNDGKYWKADRISDGQPTHLEPSTVEEFTNAWNENLRSAPVLLTDQLRKVTPRAGTFFAQGSGETSSMEPKFAGLRWTCFRHIVIGPVIQ